MAKRLDKAWVDGNLFNVNRNQFDLRATRSLCGPPRRME